MTREYWLLAVALWLLLGLIADKICEWHAKKENQPYGKPVVAAAYLAGPIILPLALLWAVAKGIRHFFK